jgi:hypothetical protein
VQHPAESAAPLQLGHLHVRFPNLQGPPRVGFDRLSVREQWRVPSAELTFVIERLL